MEHDQEVAGLLAEADQQYELGDLRKARTLYEQALARDPGAAYAHSRLGAISAQQGDLDGARESLERALELDPKLAAAHSNLGNILYTRGDHEGALQKYQQAATLDPANPVFQDNLHAAYKKLGRLTDAVAAYKQARSLDRQAARDEAKERMAVAKKRMGCGGAAAVLLLGTALGVALFQGI